MTEEKRALKSLSTSSSAQSVLVYAGCNSMVHAGRNLMPMERKAIISGTLLSTCLRGDLTVVIDSPNQAPKRMSRGRRRMFLGKIQEPHHQPNAKDETHLSVHMVGTVDEMHNKERYEICRHRHNADGNFMLDYRTWTLCA